MSHLLWELTKNNNAFLVKRNGVQFSTDPSNLSGRNLYSHSGLVHDYGLAIAQTRKDVKKPNPVVYHLRFNKRKRWIQKARKNSENVKITNQHFRFNYNSEHLPVKGLQKASQVIKKKFAHKRKDLQKLALRKLYLLHAANQPKKALQAPKAEAPKK